MNKMEHSPLHVAIQHNHLYCKPSQLKNPSRNGERVQYEKKEFTSWINGYLEQVSYCKTVSNLQEDLADGFTLLYFVQQISYESPPCIHSKPAFYVHRVENTEACLSFLDRLGVDLKGIYAEDIVSGNIKTILALCRAMHLRFEGDMLEDHRCLSPVLSWKHKSPSPSLSASFSSSGFTWPKYPWKQDSEEEASPNCFQGVSSSSGDSATRNEARPVFTVWYKEDMAVFSWIKRLLGVELNDYSEFDDGILLCAIVNQLWDESVTQEEVIYSTPLERLEIATEAAEQFLGVPRSELDLKEVIAGQGKDVIPWYLLELKAASEHMMRQYLTMAEERDRAKNEEEMVNQMRRQLIRQYSSEKNYPIHPSGCNQTTKKLPEVTKSSPLSKEDLRNDFPATERFPQTIHYPKVPLAYQRRTDTESKEPRLNTSLQDARTTPETLFPTMPHEKTKGYLPIVDNIALPDQSTAKDGMQDKMEDLETSLSALMVPDTRLSSLLEPEPPDNVDAEIIDEAPLVQWASQPSLASQPPSTVHIRSRIPSLLRQPDVSSFFSPFTMPFLAVEDRTAPAAKIRNNVKNTSSSVVDEGSLAGDKLTSWNDKDRFGKLSEAMNTNEPVSPQMTRKISTTMMARLAARSPGGVAALSSSDSED